MYYQLVDNQVLSTKWFQPRVNLMCSTCTAFTARRERRHAAAAVAAVIRRRGRVGDERAVRRGGDLAGVVAGAHVRAGDQGGDVARRAEVQHHAVVAGWRKDWIFKAKNLKGLTSCLGLNS